MMMMMMIKREHTSTSSPIEVVRAVDTMRERERGERDGRGGGAASVVRLSETAAGCHAVAVGSADGAAAVPRPRC